MAVQCVFAAGRGNAGRKKQAESNWARGRFLLTDYTPFALQAAFGCVLCSKNEQRARMIQAEKGCRAKRTKQRKPETVLFSIQFAQNRQDFSNSFVFSQFRRRLAAKLLRFLPVSIIIGKECCI